MKPKKKNDCDYLVKAVIIGDSGVGKTNILLRYCDNDFRPTYASTIGVDFKIKIIKVNEFKIKLQIWDTAGQQKFKHISTTFYKGALIIILTYSIENRQSFNNVESWVKQIHEHSSNEASIFLVANKTDLHDKRIVQFDEGQKLAQNYGMTFFEVSAKDGTNVQALFEKIGDFSYQKIVKYGQKPTRNSIKLHEQEQTTPEGRKGCSC